MDDRLHDSSADRPSGKLPETIGERIDPGRRNALLKSAAASGPLFMALAPGAAMAAASAHHGAANDAGQVPDGWSADKDGWVRVPVTYGTVTEKSGGDTFTLGDGYLTTTGDTAKDVVFYLVPAGTTSGSVAGTEGTITANNSSSAGIWMTNAGTRYVLVLFGIQSQSAVALWPQLGIVTETRQALHCSSWSSIGPDGGAPPYGGC